VLKYEGGEKAFEPVTLQGEKVKANNKVISLASGGSFAYKDAISYAEPMRLSNLELRIHASQGAKSVDFAPIQLAKGVIATSTLVINNPTPILGVQREKNTTGKYDPNIDEFQRIVPDEYTADILYLINKAEIRPSELTKGDIAKLKEYNNAIAKDPKKRLKSMEISSYASPDGALDLNTKLAKSRQDASSKFLTNELKKAEVRTMPRPEPTCRRGSRKSASPSLPPPPAATGCSWPPEAASTQSSSTACCPNWTGFRS
jgi:hypothetical protein